jgi:hypothetical protein
MGGIFLTALLWGVAGLIAVAIGAYDTMPGWFQLGSGLSILIAIGSRTGALGGLEPTANTTASAPTPAST